MMTINNDDDDDQRWRWWRSTMTMITINDDDNDNQCIAMITMMTINLSKSGEHDPCVSQVHPSLHETRFELNSSFWRGGFLKRRVFEELGHWQFSPPRKCCSELCKPWSSSRPPSQGEDIFLLLSPGFVFNFVSLTFWWGSFTFSSRKIVSGKFTKYLRIQHHFVARTDFHVAFHISCYANWQIGKKIPRPLVGMGSLEPNDKME